MIYAFSAKRTPNKAPDEIRGLRGPVFTSAEGPNEGAPKKFPNTYLEHDIYVDQSFVSRCF